MFFQVLSSFDDLINRRETIGFEENVDITYKAIVTIKKYYSYSVAMFPYTYPTNLADQGSVSNVNVVQRKFCLQFLLHISSASLLFPCMCNAIDLGRHKLSMYCFRVL